MNAFTLKEYWLSKYEDKFGDEYKSKKADIEPFLLSRLAKKYGQYVVLEATDKFFKEISKDKASILLFSSCKFFDSYFKEIIKEKDIIEYKRMLPWYNKENQQKIMELIYNYRNYLYSISLNPEDISMMESIRKDLKDIPYEE